MAKDPVRAIEKILGEADALIRRRLKAQSTDAHHVILAVTPDATGIVRSNAPPGALTELADMLKDIADQAEAPRPGTTPHTDQWSPQLAIKWPSPRLTECAGK